MQRYIAVCGDGRCCRRVDSIKGRRKEKDCSPCVLSDGDRAHVDDQFSSDSIVDVDLSPLVLRPVGVEHNEWLATHSQCFSSLVYAC